MENIEGKIDENFGKKSGKLTVISGVHPPHKLKTDSYVYTCRCDCGNITEVRKVSFVHGLKKSCGCIHMPNLLGQKFGKLTVIKDLGLVQRENDPNRDRMWLCKCECGGTIEVSTVHLRTGNVKSCGCIHKHVNVGDKFGRLIVTEILGPGEIGTLVRCKCDCGNTKDTYGHYLVAGKVRSCGCLHADVWNKYESDEERYWVNRFREIKQRCYNPKNKKYYRYGGRGIKICDEWLADPREFVKWVIANGFKREDSVDRINKKPYDKEQNGPYAPWNCRPATSKMQGNNRSDNHVLEINSEKMTVSQWARQIQDKPPHLFSLMRTGGDERVIGYVKQKLVTRSRLCVPDDDLLTYSKVADDFMERLKKI